MKPAITEATMDGVVERLLLSTPIAIGLCLEAVNQTAEFNRMTVQRQVKHVGTIGSADLVLRLWRDVTLTAVILIENKIDAPFTPDQPARYALCRDTLRARCSAPVVATLLVSPMTYLAGSRLKSGFDGVISYEQLLDLVTIEDRPIIETAIERASSPYEPEPVAAVMSFFDGYTAVAHTTAPDLKIKRNPNSASARPEASRTIYFDTRLSGFARFPFLMKDGRHASIRVSHQCWDSGAASPSVKLMLDGWGKHLSRLAPVLKRHLPVGLYLRTAGRSLAIVADTERLDNKKAADPQQEHIHDALDKIREIRRVWNALEIPLRAVERSVAE